MFPVKPSKASLGREGHEDAAPPLEPPRAGSHHKLQEREHTFPGALGGNVKSLAAEEPGREQPGRPTSWEAGSAQRRGSVRCPARPRVPWRVALLAQRWSPAWMAAA
jgi:hypothetical protein